MKNFVLKDYFNKAINPGDLVVLLFKTYGYRKISSADLVHAIYIGYDSYGYNFKLKNQNSLQYVRYKDPQCILHLRKTKLQDQYSVMLGPNTNQIWIYNNTRDYYIDPPMSFTNLYPSKSCEELEDILNKDKPFWLYDECFHYKDIEI